jgi:hypothetical protein
MVGELVSMMGQVEEFKEVRAQIELDMRVKSKDSAQVKKMLDSVKKSDIEKIASIKQRMLESQKRVALKTKEISQKTSQVKVAEHTTQRQLQGQIMQCCYTDELNREVINALLEQQRAMKEYQTFSKTLDPEVKSYFDKIMDSVGDFCHRFNDYMQRSSEITDMYLYLDDTLTDEFQRHEIKESIINREIREKRNNWLELAETGLRSLEFTALAGVGKVMTSATREIQLVRMLNEGRAISHAKDFTSRLQLETKLAFEEAGILDKYGVLTPKAVAESDVCILKEPLGNPELLPKLAEINPDLKNWAKYETMPVRIESVQANRRIHFYKHEITGQTYLGIDFKVKEDVALNRFFFKSPSPKGGGKK